MYIWCLPFCQYLVTYSQRFVRKLFKRVFIDILKSSNLSTISNHCTKFLSLPSSPSNLLVKLVPYVRPRVQLYVPNTKLQMISVSVHRVHPFCAGILKVPTSRLSSAVDTVRSGCDWLKSSSFLEKTTSSTTTTGHSGFEGHAGFHIRRPEEGGRWVKFVRQSLRDL